MMVDWHLAQINVGRFAHPREDTRLQPFFDALDAINALADAAPGFVWRLGAEGDAAIDVQATTDPRLIVNMSVWETAEALFDYVYHTDHRSVMVRRREWFERFGSAHQALWWIPAGHRPTVDEGLARLWHLDRFGPTPRAFTFKKQFPAPDELGPPIDHQPDPWCIGWT